MSPWGVFALTYSKSFVLGTTRKRLTTAMVFSKLLLFCWGVGGRSQQIKKVILEGFQELRERKKEMSLSTSVFL